MKKINDSNNDKMIKMFDSETIMKARNVRIKVYKSIMPYFSVDVSCDWKKSEEIQRLTLWEFLVREEIGHDICDLYGFEANMR